jgi:hypothetical protein
MVCSPLGDDTYRITPYPFDKDELDLALRCRTLSGKQFPSQEAFRAALAEAPAGRLRVRIVR